MAEPTEDISDLEWATNTNYAGGEDVGTVTKDEPSAGRKADGWRGGTTGDKPPGQEWNWWRHWLVKWVRFIWEEAVEPEHNNSGRHKRITKNSNLLMNPTGRRGNAHWWDAGGGAAVNHPGYGTSANFSEFEWSDGSAGGPKWKIGLAAMPGFKGDLSEKIPINTAGVSIVLSAESWLQAYTAGSFFLDVTCYDNADNYLSTICEIEINATESDFTLHEATGVTPANTDYVCVRKYIDGTASADFWNIRLLKLERGDKATAYSDECSMGQYLSARRTSNNGTQTLTTDVQFYPLFENPTSDSDVFDDPGVDRYTPGTGYFEADRHMKLDVACEITLASAVWIADKIFRVDIYLTPLGAGEAIFAKLGRVVVEVNTAKEITCGGSSIIELNKGDKFRIGAVQTSGINQTITADPVENHLDIHEIP